MYPYKKQTADHVIIISLSIIFCVKISIDRFNFIAKILIRTGQTLAEVQTHLDKEGASELVVELVIKSVNSPAIFLEAVQLGMIFAYSIKFYMFF